MPTAIVQGVFVVDPTVREQFLAASLEGIHASRTEPGCQEYVLAADPADPARVIVSERWDSMEHLSQHTQAVKARRAEAAERGLTRPEPISRDVKVYEAVDSHAP